MPRAQQIAQTHHCASILMAVFVCVRIVISEALATSTFPGRRVRVRRGDAVSGNAGKFGKVAANVAALVVVIAGVVLVGGAVLDSDAEAQASCSARPPSAESMQRIRTERQGAKADLREANSELRRAQATANRAPNDRDANRRLATATHEQSRAARRLTRQGAVTPTVSEGAQTTFKLGRDPAPGVRSIDFSLERRVLSGPRAVRLTVGRFRPEESGRELSRSSVEAWARLTPDRSVGTIYVCVNNRIIPGTFSGAVAFADPRLARVVVPVSLTRSYPNVEKVAIVGLAVCLLASMYVFFLRLPKKLLDDSDGRTALRWPFTFIKGYWEFATDMLGIITIVAGGAAAVAAFTAQYLNAEAWTPDVGSWLTYCGAVGTAFVAGGTAGKLAQKSYEKADDKNAKSGA